MKAKRILSIVVLTTWGLVFWPPAAKATLITIEIEGVVDYVTDEGNYLEGKVEPGDIIAGFYTYESTTPDSSPADPVQGNYRHYDPPAGISLSVSGLEFRTDPTNVEFRIAIRNDIPPAGGDIYAVGSRNNLPLSNGTPVDSIGWQLNDYAGSAFSSDALPLTPPILGDWRDGNSLWIEGVPRQAFFGIAADVTCAVPEPAVVGILGVGGLMVVSRKRKEKTES